MLAAAPDIAATVSAVLDRRLSGASVRPVAVALSGGGDSVALLLAAQRWAAARGRPLIALTVDHQLQPGSAAWTADCAALAARLGVAFEPLVWSGEKPSQGLPAAARAARHRLLAKAARAAGAGVVLIGHTADDLAEARAMRQAGSTTPAPREWSPSPVWPEGRGIFLARPLLALRRVALRDWLRARGEAWIEDPANADLRYARARARADLLRADLAGGGEIAQVQTRAQTPPLRLAARSTLTPWGGMTIDTADLQSAQPADVARWLALACVCAGGGERLPPTAARDRLARRLTAGEVFAASLAGARVEADGGAVHILREAGEAGRGGMAAAALPAGERIVWDGRFELTAAGEHFSVRRLGGVARRLSPQDQRALAALPPAARPGLPAILDAAGKVTSPVLGASPVACAPLVGGRFAAAAGLVEREPDAL